MKRIDLYTISSLPLCLKLASSNHAVVRDMSHLSVSFFFFYSFFFYSIVVTLQFLSMPFIISGSNEGTIIILQTIFHLSASSTTFFDINKATIAGIVESMYL